MTCLIRVRHYPHIFFAALGVLVMPGLLPLDAGVSAQQPAVDYAAQEPVVPVDYSDEIPAHISAVDGAATLEREGRIEDAEENSILLAGDRLRTARGRLEILYSDGSSVAVDEQTTIDLLDDSLMRLMGGRVKLIVARATGSLGTGLTRPRDPRWCARRENTALPFSNGARCRRSISRCCAVPRSSSTITDARSSVPARMRSPMRVRRRRFPTSRTPRHGPSSSAGPTISGARVLAPTRRDICRARCTTTRARSIAMAIGTTNRRTATSGIRVSRTGWRPYHHGKWSHHLRFGWFWVGAGRWAWPTHHYGRWGVSSGRWYWIPDRHWGPAWVSWAYAPGYVSWCPLGFNNRPVFSITTITINHHQPWHGWTVLPSRHFVPNVAVPRHVVTSASLPVSTWSDFRPSRPNLREDPAPIRSVGSSRGFAVPRSSTGVDAGFARQASPERTAPGASGATAGARSAQRDGATPGAAVPSGSRSPVGSRLASPGIAPSRAVPSDRPGTPIEARSPVRLRSAPAPDAGTAASSDRNTSERTAPRVGSPSRISPPPRTQPDDRSASPPPGSAIRRSQPAPGRLDVVRLGVALSPGVTTSRSRTCTIGPHTRCVTRGAIGIAPRSGIDPITAGRVARASPRRRDRRRRAWNRAAAAVHRLLRREVRRPRAHPGVKAAARRRQAALIAAKQLDAAAGTDAAPPTVKLEVRS